MATKRLEVQITGNARGAQRAFADVESSAGGMQSKLSNVSRNIAGAVAGATIAVAGGVTLALSGAYSAALDAQKISRETERVIQTTGGAANITATQVSDLATAISDLTGVDDEIIQAGENLLLTFTNIRNQAGKGNDIFSQASGLALDMSTVLGTDMNSAVMQVGKALNDPVKGLQSLSRAGVSFTEDQKAQIKALAANGDILGAQKIILGELSREFGGAAAAAAGPMDRLKVQLGNVQEEIGARLIPVMAAAADWITDTMIPAVQGAIGSLTDGFNGEGNGDFWSRLGDRARAAYEFVTGTVVPAITDAFNTVRDAVQRIDFVKIMDTLRGAFGDIDFAGWARGLSDLFGPVIEAVRSFDLPEYFDALSEAFSALWGAAGDAIDAIEPLMPVLKVVGGALAAVAYVANRVFVAQLRALAWIVENVVSPVLQAIGWYIENVMVPGWKLIGEVAGAAFSWIADRVRDWWGVVEPLFQVALKWVTEHLLPVFVGFRDRMTEVFETIRATIKDKVDAVAGFITGLPGRFASIRDRLYQVIVEPFKSAFNAVAGFWNNTVGKLEFTIPDWVPEFGGNTIAIPDIPVLHDGGEFRAPRGRSEGLALLRDREVVLTPRQARGRGQGGTVINANFHGVSVKAAMAELQFQERRAW